MDDERGDVSVDRSTAAPHESGSGAPGGNGGGDGEKKRSVTRSTYVISSVP